MNKDLSIELAIPEHNAVLCEAISRVNFGGKEIRITRDVRGDFFANARCHEESRVYVAWINGEVAGSAAGSVRRGFVDGSLQKLGYIFQLFVSPDHRRRGVARILVEHVEKYLLECNVDLLFLAVEGENTLAQRLFTGSGYEMGSVERRIGFAPVKLKKRSENVVRQCNESDFERVFDLVNQTWHGYGFFAPLTRESFSSISGRKPDFSIENLFVAERSGHIVACACLWDSSVLSTNRVHWLAPKLRLLGAFSTVLRPIVPIPTMPKAGGELKSAMLIGMVG